MRSRKLEWVVFAAIIGITIVLSSAVWPSQSMEELRNGSGRTIKAGNGVNRAKITATAAANGSISPAGNTTVASGASQTYTITPKAGFKVSALSVDGTVLPGATTFTFTNVTANHYINAYFE